MNYAHLLALTTPRGVFEHCKGQTPLPEHGYCVDDVARALIVIARDPSPPSVVDRVVDTCMGFLAAAQHVDGSIINRQNVDGERMGDPDVGDHWGRALWAWGTVVARSSDADRIERAIGAFRLSSGQRSPHLRSMAHAALGAAEYLTRFPTSTSALGLLADARAMALRRQDPSIPWPERRLTYANAVIPQAVIAAGLHLGESDTLDRGLEMLGWLTSLQSPNGHLSPIGNGGWAPGDALPSFDQQPLEVAHLVDACITAFDATSDTCWLDVAQRGAMWFYGVNDIGEWMHDPRTGAGFDGLTPDGPNPNCGAESTLAYLSAVGQISISLDALRVH